MIGIDWSDRLRGEVREAAVEGYDLSRFILPWWVILELADEMTWVADMARPSWSEGDLMGYFAGIPVYDGPRVSAVLESRQTNNNLEGVAYHGETDV